MIKPIETVRPSGEGRGSVQRDGLRQDGDTAEAKIHVEELPVEEGADKGEDQQEVAEGPDEEEGQQPKVTRVPKGPTRKEREEHEATHIPYRDWCAHCVRGRAINRQHRRTTGSEDAERKVPKISMDYFFMSQEEEKASDNPMIVVLDEANGNRYMRAVGRKGLGEGKEMEWLIKDIHEELKSWGYPGGGDNELIMKSDGEPSIVAVREAVSRYHGGRVTPEQPPTGESEANGRVEEAGKTLRGYLKVFKDMIEDRAGVKLDTGAVILQWLVRWVAMLHSRFRRGPDGKTAYEKQMGRACKVEVVPFGETVMYKRLEESGRKKNKLESSWEHGVWLGHARGSNESLVGTADGVVRAWAIKRKAEGERWCKERIQNIRGTPQRPNPNMPGSDIPIHVRVHLEEPGMMPADVRPARNEGVPRRTYLKPRDFRKHGFSEDCEGCRRIKTGGMGNRPHTEECRARMEEVLKAEKDPRWERAKDRMDEKVWEEVQKEDARREAEATSSQEAPTISKDDEGQGLEEHAGDEQADGAEAQEETAGQDNKRDPETEEGAKKRPRWEDPKGKKREMSSDEREITGSDEKKRREVGEDDLMETEIIKGLLKVDVAEVYSPRRMTEQARKFGLQVGEAMDLTTGWDFGKEEDRARAEMYLDEKKPRLLIGSPRCAMFSKLQNLTPWTPKRRKMWDEAKEHIRFVVKLYKKQMRGGRLFLHEQPAEASSWSLREVREFRKQAGVVTVDADQCMYGLQTWGKGRRGLLPAKKRTKFMTNSAEIARELGRKCEGKHDHQQLVGGRAESSANYPEELCRAICRGLIREQKQTVMDVRAVCEVSIDSGSRKIPDPEDFHEQEEAKIAQLVGTTGVGVAAGAAWDDLTGMALDADEVKAARRKEIDYVREKEVWVKISRQEAQKKGWKIIKTRWIDINKGDDEEPVYRSRLVGKEFNDGAVAGLFAGTPPLEALRYLVHEAATVRRGGKDTDTVMMINDVARAFFEAKATRNVCIELPEEDMTEEDRKKDRVGWLKKSLYGTRDAAMNWQEEVANVMQKWGFQRSRYNPCLYVHEKWGIMTLVRGDDFVSVGSREGMHEFKGKLEGRFEIKTRLVGSGEGEEAEARVLNRVIRVTPEGWEYEPDQRHAEMIIKDLGLNEAKSVATPGEEEKKWEEELNKEELMPDDATRFRAIAARMNYVAADRPDLMYSVKEICRNMARPTRGAWKKLKRVGRYLIGKPRMVLKYRWQGEEEEVDGYTDSDWAGCRVTGKSTSGGAIMVGGAFLEGLVQDPEQYNAQLRGS